MDMSSSGAHSERWAGSAGLTGEYEREPEPLLRLDIF
jgi:hypothetical protein